MNLRLMRATFELRGFDERGEDEQHERLQYLDFSNAMERFMSPSYLIAQNHHLCLLYREKYSNDLLFIQMDGVHMMDLSSMGTITTEYFTQRMNSFVENLTSMVSNPSGVFVSVE